MTRPADRLQVERDRWARVAERQDLRWTRLIEQVADAVDALDGLDALIRTCSPEVMAELLPACLPIRHALRVALQAEPAEPPAVALPASLPARWRNLPRESSL